MMNRRDLVKAAIAHKTTERVPYCISFTPNGEKRFQELIGMRSAKDFADNDIIQVNAPWWEWHQLGPEWQSTEPPPKTATVRGNGSYKDFFDSLKMFRDNSDKYILVMIYGSHFEKAYFARELKTSWPTWQATRPLPGNSCTALLKKTWLCWKISCALPKSTASFSAATGGPNWI